LAHIALRGTSRISLGAADARDRSFPVGADEEGTWRVINDLDRLETPL
jgi:hypothetical protein